MLGLASLSSAALSSLADANVPSTGIAVGTCTVIGIGVGEFFSTGAAIGSCTVLGIGTSVIDTTLEFSVLTCVSQSPVEATGAMNRDPISILGNFLIPEG